MVLSWLVVAKRPLQWHEVQCLKAMTLDKESAEYDLHRFMVTPKDLLHSLVDWREDGTIQLVHPSAR